MSTATEALALLRAGDASEAAERLAAGVAEQPDLEAPLRLIRAGYLEYAGVVLDVVASGARDAPGAPCLADPSVGRSAPAGGAGGADRTRKIGTFAGGEGP